MEALQLRIHRESCYVGMAMGIRVFFNNQKIYTIKNGETAMLTIPAQPGYLNFEMVGNSMNFHPIKGSVYIDPSQCRQGAVDCRISVEKDILGILLGGLLRKVGSLKIELHHL